MAVPAGQAGFPVGVKQLRTEINGTTTDVIVNSYKNVKLVMVTQTGAVGTVVEARPDVSLEGKSTYNTSILLGKRDEPLIQLAARQMVEIASPPGTNTPLLVCLALKDHSPTSIKQLLTVVMEQQLLA